jgi:hypothetical protein
MKKNNKHQNEMHEVENAKSYYLGWHIGTIPKKCCDCGSNKCVIPMSSMDRLVGVDLCISDIVAALNASNIPTMGMSCCGHGEQDGEIWLRDGRVLIIQNMKHFVGKQRKSMDKRQDK